MVIPLNLLYLLELEMPRSMAFNLLNYPRPLFKGQFGRFAVSFFVFLKGEGLAINPSTRPFFEKISQTTLKKDTILCDIGFLLQERGIAW